MHILFLFSQMYKWPIGWQQFDVRKKPTKTALWGVVTWICASLFRRGFQGPLWSRYRCLPHCLNLQCLACFMREWPPCQRCYTLHLGLFGMHHGPFCCCTLEKLTLSALKQLLITAFQSIASCFDFSHCPPVSAAKKVIKRIRLQLNHQRWVQTSDAMHFKKEKKQQLRNVQ